MHIPPYLCGRCVGLYFSRRWNNVREFPCLLALTNDIYSCRRTTIIKLRMSMMIIIKLGMSMILRMMERPSLKMMPNLWRAWASRGGRPFKLPIGGRGTLPPGIHTRTKVGNPHRVQRSISKWVAGKVQEPLEESLTGKEYGNFSLQDGCLLFSIFWRPINEVYDTSYFFGAKVLKE